MIVPMKKVSLIIFDRDRKTALSRLRESGVLHLEEKPAGSGEKMDSLLEMQSRVLSATSKLDVSVKGEKSEGAVNRDEILKLIDETLEIDQKISQLHKSLAEINSQIELLKPYGDFEPADLDILRSKGVDIRLFDTEVSSLPEIKASGATVFLLQKKKKKVLLAAVYSQDAPDEFAAMAVKLPEYGVRELVSMHRDMEKQFSDLNGKLGEISKRREDFERLQAEIEQDIEFEALTSGTQGDGTLIWMSGFIPDDKVSSLRELSSKEGWGIMIREPGPDDPIPTLIKNGPKVRIIQPVFDFLGTIPGYREYDISIYFLSYFTVFFAMIIGDAGYGLLFLLGAVFLALKNSKTGKPLPDAVRLLFLLSTATVAWGAVTGNWFGSKAIASIPLFRHLTIPAIATFPDLFPGAEINPQSTIMWICFLLGLSQLTLANVMNFIREFPGLKAFSYLGWGSIIGGLYFLVLQLVISSPMPGFAVIMIGGGFVLVIVFGEQGKGIGFVKGLLKGFGGAFTTFLDAISSFSNIISYIRLFAVGMSSFYIASSFNNLAAPMLKGWTIPVGILIIAIGHGLNLVMGLLSVVVHGIRLNMLEFSGQLGMEWTGIEYNPFRVRISEENNNQGVPS